MFVILILICVTANNCFTAQQNEHGDWVSVSAKCVQNAQLQNSPQISNKPRSMSEGGDVPLRSIQQQTPTQLARSMQQSMRTQHDEQTKSSARVSVQNSSQENDERVYLSNIERIKTLSIQIGTKGVDENYKNKLKEEFVRLKLEINTYDKKNVQGLFKRIISEASRNRLHAEFNMLCSQREMLEMEYRLITEHFDSYVQQILVSQHAKKSDEVERDIGLLGAVSPRAGSEDFLIAENKILRAQNEMHEINRSSREMQFNDYLRTLLRTQYLKKEEEMRSLSIQAKELELIEIDGVLKNNELSKSERDRIEVKFLTAKWHVKRNELSKLHESMKSMSLSQSELECVSLEADILKKQIRIIEVENSFKKRGVSLNQEESEVLKLEQLRKEAEFLEKRKKYTQLKWQLKDTELARSEQMKLETAFAFLHAEILAIQKSGKECEDLNDILLSYKRAYERMNTIEGHFREDQKIGLSMASSASRVMKRCGPFPLHNCTKYQLSVQYAELFNQIRRNTIGQFLHRERILDELKTAMKGRDFTAGGPFLLNEEQGCLFGINELTDPESFNQFLERELIPTELMSRMQAEYWGTKERYPFVKQENGRFDFVEDTTRSIYDYGLIESYLLNGDQRCQLGVKYLELSGLEPIMVEFLEAGGPV